MNFVQGEAGAAADVDEDALGTLNGIVFEERTGDGAVSGVMARLVPVAMAVPITA